MRSLDGLRGTFGGLCGRFGRGCVYARHLQQLRLLKVLMARKSEKKQRRYTLIEQLCSFLEYVENKHNSLFNTDYTEYWIEKITNYFEDPHGGSYRVP